VILGGLCALAFFVENAWQSWGAVHLESDLGASPALGALAPALFAGAAALSRLGAHGLAGRVSELVLLRAGALLGATGTLLGALATGAAPALAGVAMAGAGISICAPVLFSIAGRSADHAVRGAAVSIVTTIAYLGFLVGPAAVGLLAGATALGTSLAAVAGVALVLAILAPRAPPGRGRLGRQAAARPLQEARGLADQELWMIRLAWWGVVANAFATRSGDAPNGGRFVARERGPAFWLALWALAIAAEFGALVPVFFPGDEQVEAVQVVYRLIGGSFAACGLIAWRRRPDSRSGLLMAAAGGGFFVSALLSQFDPPVAQTAGLVLTELWAPFFAALLLTLLTGGRFEATIDRVLVAGFVLALWILQVVWLLFYEQDGNLLAIFPNAGIADAVDKSQRSLAGVVCVALAAVVALRWRAASRPRRRALLPSVAGSAALLLFAALLTNDLVTGSRSQVVLWAAVISLVSVPAAFLVGLLRSRLARGGLADLFRDLKTTRGGDLQGALARTLGDPSLVVAYRLPGSLGYADADGRPVLVPPVAADRSTATVESDGAELAALVYDASLDDDPELVEAVRAAAGMALENERLQAETQARLAEVHASRERIVAAGDAERRRLERNLHDGAQQRLVALSLQLRLLQGRVGDDPSAQELVSTASDQLAESLSELRELARGIHPAVLNHGLAAALESLAARSPVPTTVSYEADDRLPEPVALAAYFVASEALTNVAKYAQASAVTVRVSQHAGSAVIEIADDGVGGADEAGGSGLRGLADRVAALDGRLRVVSPAGAGTVVTAELPCG
jgi:signal transduction histidine kinase